MPRIYKPAVCPSDNKAERPTLETKSTAPKKPSEKKESGDS